MHKKLGKNSNISMDEAVNDWEDHQYVDVKFINFSRTCYNFVYCKFY